jgi:hypothetical protein
MKWIATNHNPDAMPSHSCLTLVRMASLCGHCKNTGHYYAIVQHNGENWEWRSDQAAGDYVTHWAPIEPPEDVE